MDPTDKSWVEDRIYTWHVVSDGAATDPQAFAIVVGERAMRILVKPIGLIAVVEPWTEEHTEGVILDHPHLPALVFRWDQPGAMTLDVGAHRQTPIEGFSRTARMTREDERKVSRLAGGKKRFDRVGLEGLAMAAKLWPVWRAWFDTTFGPELYRQIAPDATHPPGRIPC